MPDPLASRSISLDGEVAADVADAEAAIRQLNADAATLVNTEALARLILRAESVASSRIEGLEVGGRRLLRAEAARDLGDDANDVTAAEVLGNIDAMVWSVSEVASKRRVEVADLLAIHERLLAGTRLTEHAGRIRTVQNWIGGSSYNPCSAAFVPPPPQRVSALLEDLCEFCNDDGLPAVAQAAIAHAQFETIHPFVDGNGRAGRALIHIVLQRRGIAPRVLPPVSLILATWSRDYVAGLTATRYQGTPASRDAHEGINRWIALFASASVRSVADVMAFERRTIEIERSWRDRLGRVRANSAADLLLRSLAGAPIVTVASAANLIGRSQQATNDAIGRLHDAGVLTQVNVGRRRNRAFEASDVVDAFSDFERQLASPEADTLAEPPVRSVPRRRAAKNG